MALSGSRYRTATAQGTLVAFVLVLVFGSPWYVDWVDGGNRGLFLETLAWPRWFVSSSATARDLFAADLKAILLIVFTAVFVALMCGSQLSRARGGISAILSGWGAYIFAAALSAFICRLILNDASISACTVAAAGGATYGLIVGWVVGIATMASRRS